MAWRLNKFCGCGELETGGWVIGTLQLIFSIFGIISSIVLIVACVVILNDPDKSSDDISTAKSWNFYQYILTYCILIKKYFQFC